MGAGERGRDDGSGPTAGVPADGLEALLEEAHDAHLRARSAAARVVVGFTLGAEVDAVGRAIAGFERSTDPTGDLERARALLDRAKRVAVEARRQQREHRRRTTNALAGVVIGRR